MRLASGRSSARGALIGVFILTGCSGIDIRDTSSQPHGIIVIGEAGEVENLIDSDFDEEYRKYVELVGYLTPPTVDAMSMDDFRSSVAGRTTIVFAKVPVVFAAALTAWVTRHHEADSGLEQSMAAPATVSTGDLVVGRTQADGVVFLVRTLCERGKDYKDCTSRYEKGMFDATSGMQLTFSMVPKENGIRIDTASFQPEAE